MKRHIVPTVEVFAKYAEALAADIGGTPLHPANRMTACGKRMGELSVTTDPKYATCATCIKSAATAATPPLCHDCPAPTACTTGRSCRSVRVDDVVWLPDVQLQLAQVGVTLEAGP